MISWQCDQSTGKTSTKAFERVTMLVAEAGVMLIMSSKLPRNLAPVEFRAASNDTTIGAVSGADHSQRQTRPDADSSELMARESPLRRHLTPSLQHVREPRKASEALSVVSSRSSTKIDQHNRVLALAEKLRYIHEMPSSGRQGAPTRSKATERFESESARKVKKGEMLLDDYLEERVEQALAHLKGKIAESTLEAARFALREKLRTDPALVEAVRQATGRTPEPFPRPGKS